MKLGVFSGTFDPVHDGHVGFAQAAKKQLGLDKVIFMPEASPRRKDNVSSQDVRTDMLDLALSDYDWAEVYIAKTDNHSVEETLAELKNKYGGETELYFLMGVDVYGHLQEWPGYEDLIGEAKIILSLKTEDDGELAIELAAKLSNTPTMIISSDPELSSSKIRSGKQTGVDHRVTKYIHKKQLYV